MKTNTRTLRFRRLHMVTDNINRMEREFQAFKDTGHHPWLEQPEKRASAEKRLARFKAEKAELERLLNAPWWERAILFTLAVIGAMGIVAFAMFQATK